MKKIIYSTIVLILLITPNFFAVATRNDILGKGWKAGVARVKITPESSVWLGGYASRTHGAEGKIQDLWAKALAIEDANEKQVVLVSADLIGFPKKVSDDIRDRLGEKYNLTRAQIILNSSHTHSGPVVGEGLADIYPMEQSDWEKVEKYSAKLEDDIVALVGRAINSIKPVDIYSGNGVTRFQVNRRNNNERQLKEQTELKGPNDFAVPVIKLVNKRGKIIAVAFGYACHGTVLNGYQWSGDYMGFAQAELEKIYKGTTAIFLQGAAGDQNPLPRRSVALAQQYGKELASAVERVLSEEMKPLSPELSFAYNEVELHLENPPSESELTRRARDLKGYEQRWANRLLGMLKEGVSIETSYPYPLQIWKLGEQLIFTLGGEPLINYTLNLKKLFGQDIFVFGYTNDVMAYIPTVDVLNEGGYEGESSQRVYGLPGKWKPDVEKKVLQGMVNLSGRVGVSQTKTIQEKLDSLLDENISMKSESVSLIAKQYYSGFPLAHDTYNAISTGSDGKIYYVLSSQLAETGGQMYVYNPATDKTRFIADLTDACGEKDLKAISQGKSHVRFYESGGKLYFATHVGYYEMIDGMERLPVNAPEGYKLYPGGHIISYNLSDGTFENLALAPKGEGIITLQMDRERGQIYCVTWPTGYFLHYSINTGELKNLGPISVNGEAGVPGDDYRVLCRSMFVDSREGTVYYSTSGGPIYIDGRRVKGVDEIAMGAARGLENLHLITYNIPRDVYIDHGPIFYKDGSRPTYVNSIAVGRDGSVYTLARFEYEGKTIEDLVKIPDPFFIKN